MNCLCLCLCLPSKSKSKSQIATTLALLWAFASDCRGLLVAQALFQVTAKLAQQANSLSFVNMLWLAAHCSASQTGYYKRKLACHRQHCPLESCLLMFFAVQQASNFPSCWQQIRRSADTPSEQTPSDALLRTWHSPRLAVLHNIWAPSQIAQASRPTQP